MNKYRGSKFVVVISILLAAVWVIPALSDAPPSGDVMTLEGNLNIDGETASPGTVITAKAGDELLGRVEVSEGGTFGDKAWNKLYIKEPSGTDKSVTLYAKSPDMTDSIKIVESITWSKGMYQIDIDAVTTSTNYNGGNTGSSSSGKYKYTIIPLNDNDGASAGGAGIDTTPVSGQETTSPQESDPVSDGGASGKGSSSTTVIIIALIVILAIVAFLIYQKVK